VIDYRNADLVAEVGRLTDGRGADIVLESVGGDTFRQSVEVARRVTGKVVVIGAAAGEASISNRELNFRHPVHVIGQHLTTTIRHAPELFAKVLAELDELIEAG